TIPCGYADGLTRALTNNGDVLINRKRYPICGTITMDHFLVDAGDDDIAVGDEVVIVGRQGEEEISAAEVASRIDTIAYEVVCGISSRVPRRYAGT
ncbi:MAG: alanine racemase, partial [Actinobacteria bacterium]|nr:alanine racemase [Actinomycetota bacterium]